MIFEDAVHIPISVLKLDSCFSLRHPKITHFSLYNFTLHRGAFIEFHFITMSIYWQYVQAPDINNIVVIFTKTVVTRLSAVPLNVPGDKIFLTI